MAGSVNKVILIGNLGQNPELKYLPSGQPVCEFSIATTDVYNDKQGQRQEKTEWHRIKVWGKTAENCGQYLQKGRSVYVEGRLSTRSYDDKDGQKKYITEVVAMQVVFLGSAPGTAPGAEGAPRAARPAGSGGGRPPGGGGGGGGSSGGGGDAPPDFGSGGGTDDDIPF